MLLYVILAFVMICTGVITWSVWNMSISGNEIVHIHKVEESRYTDDCK